MIELVSIVVLTIIVILVCRLLLKTRILTAITMGFLIGALLAGFLLRGRGVFEDFEDDTVALNSTVYAVMGIIAAILLILHLFVSLYREWRRS